MAASTSSSLLASPRFSCHIAGSPTPAPRYAPSVRIRSWRPFAAPRCEVSLVPARLPRTPPRCWNTLREKASQSPPPLIVQHQVRPPYDQSPEIGSLDSQESKSGSLDGDPSSDLDEKLEMFGGLGASQSGNVASESELDGEKDVTGVFSVYEDPEPEGNVVRDEVGDEVINRSEAADGERSGNSDAMLSRARLFAMELKSGRRVASKNSSLLQSVAAEWVAPPVRNGVGSVAQRNASPLGSRAWCGFAALCSACLVLAASKLIWRNSKDKLLRRLFYMDGPWDERG